MITTFHQLNIPIAFEKTQDSLQVLEFMDITLDNFLWIKLTVLEALLQNLKLKSPAS